MMMMMMGEEQARAGDQKEDELSFHAVNGMRVRRLFRLLSSREDKFANRLFMMVDECSRTLAHYFQRASEGRLRDGRPFLQDLTNPGCSPLVCCLQYLSGLLVGGPSVSRLVVNVETC